MISFTPEHIFLVTGASSGLGAAGALLLNSLGATVILSDAARWMTGQNVILDGGIGLL